MRMLYGRRFCICFYDRHTQRKKGDVFIFTGPVSANDLVQKESAIKATIFFCKNGHKKMILLADGTTWQLRNYKILGYERPQIVKRTHAH